MEKRIYRRPAMQCRELGIEGGVSQVAEMAGVQRATLYNWSRTRPNLWRAIVLGCGVIAQRDNLRIQNDAFAKIIDE
jgi:hypothetical protein